MIKISGLSRAFANAGKVVQAVDQVDLDVKPGRVFGLLGPNGAGKTTTLRIIATLLKPDEGQVLVAGHDVEREPDAVRGRLGFLTGATGLYDRLTPRETLSYFGQLQGMKRDRIEERVEDLAKALLMEEFMDRRVGKLSTGQKAEDLHRACHAARSTGCRTG